MNVFSRSKRTVENARRIFDKAVRTKLNGSVVYFGGPFVGTNHYVFNVATMNETQSGRTQDLTYMVKIPINASNSRTYVNDFALSEWRKLGVPVPKVRDVTTNYLIERKLDGITLSDAELTREEGVPVFTELGGLLNTMHQARVEGFGTLNLKHSKKNKALKGKYKTWGDYVGAAFAKRLEAVKEHGAVKYDVIEGFERIRGEAEGKLDLDEPTLLHGDFHTGNVIVGDDGIAGIIDAEGVIGGDPNYDLGYFIGRDVKRGGLHTPSLLRGYGEFDPQMVEFYAALLALRKLGKAVVSGDEDKTRKAGMDFSGIVKGSVRKLIGKL
jgi:aminoglycoside phosphotransferase (APT) family kinase protein